MQDESLIKWYFRKEYEKQTQIHWIKRTGSASLQGQYGKGSFLRGTLISNVTKWFSTRQKTSFGKDIFWLCCTQVLRAEHHFYVCFSNLEGTP